MTSQRDDAADLPVAVPPYAGTADQGVRSSVPADDPMAGELAGLLRTEFAKLSGLYGDLVALLDAGRLDEARTRWFGVVRETLEFEAACQRVVVPEVADAAAGLPDDAAPEALVERLRPYDELNPDLTPDEARTTALTTVEALRAQAGVLVSAAQTLDADLRDRLGEDLRQVMG